jgi:hypothetical protein
MMNSRQRRAEFVTMFAEIDEKRVEVSRRIVDKLLEDLDKEGD